MQQVVSVTKQGSNIVATPNTDFWLLAGSLRSTVKLSDVELKVARRRFSHSFGTRWKIDLSFDYKLMAASKK